MQTSQEFPEVVDAHFTVHDGINMYIGNLRLLMVVVCEEEICCQEINKSDRHRQCESDHGHAAVNTKGPKLTCKGAGGCFTLLKAPRRFKVQVLILFTV